MGKLNGASITGESENYFLTWNRYDKTWLPVSMSSKTISWWTACPWKYVDCLVPQEAICKEQDSSCPNKGYCASQGFHFYGYKLHAVCSIEGVFQSFDLSPASVHDIHYLKDIKQQISDCVLLGDKGYLSASAQLDLFNSANIHLETPKRKNQKDYRPQ